MFMPSLKTPWRVTVTYIKAHKALSLVLLLIAAALTYWLYTQFSNGSAETQYVVNRVERGSLSSLVSGSGQVSAENQIELTAKVSGDIIALPVANGDAVRQGATIAQLDARDAQKAVRDAEVNLESAKLALQKLEQPATSLSITQAKNALTDAESALSNAYDEGFSETSDTFLTLPAIMSGLDGVLYDNTVSASQDNLFAYADMIDEIEPSVVVFRNDAEKKYKEARAVYEAGLTQYKATSRFSTVETIEKLILDTYQMTKTIADAEKSVSDLLNLVNDSLVLRERTIPTILTSHRASLSQYIGDTNTQLGTLLAIKDTITSSGQAIQERTEALRDLEDGTDPLDIAAQKLTIVQRENSLRDARENLADYYVSAPFSGTVAKINVKRSDRVTSGTSIATFITSQQIAEISLNEIDAASISVGQNVSLTFDAVEGLSLPGTIVELDTVGTTASGVVTYTATIGFETDMRIKPGMTVNADITTASTSDTLIVASAAVKEDREGSYVEVIDTTDNAQNIRTLTGVTPRRVGVITGLANDTHTEILQGLTEGMMVVVRTIAGGAAEAAQAPSIFQATGAQRPSGGTGGARPSPR